MPNQTKQKNKGLITKVGSGPLDMSTAYDLLLVFNFSAWGYIAA